MDNLIGKRLDGLYEVQELIGSGGMANVYKAVMRGQNGPVPAGTVVAVKVLRREYMHDPDLVRRFKNESKAISLLNHPNIVKVYDVSVNDNLQYIVMEYVDGMTLREYLNERGGKLSSRETVHFISQILKALENNDIVGEAASVDVTSTEDIILWYGTRYQVNLGDTSRLDYKVDCMNDAILQMSDYQSGVLDISFTIWPNQVGYTPVA